MPQGRSQMRRTRRRRDSSTQNVHGRDRSAIVTRVFVLLGSDDRALRRHARKKSFASAISVNRRGRGNGGFRISSNRSSCDTGVSAKSHVTTVRKCAYGGFVVQDKNEVGGLSARLQAKACAARGDERWPGPAVTSSRNDYAVSGFGAKNKARLYHRDDGKTSGVSQYVPRNRFLGHVAKIPNDVGAMVDGFLFVGLDRGHERERGDDDER